MRLKQAILAVPLSRVQYEGHPCCVTIQDDARRVTAARKALRSMSLGRPTKLTRAQPWDAFYHSIPAVVQSGWSRF